MAILFQATGWEPGPWIAALRRLMPDADIRVWPQVGAPEQINYALVWKPPAELFKALPNLKVIFSLGAGVDHLLQLTNLPQDIPIVRVTDADLTARMSEYMALHVLMHHRRQRDHDAAQARGEWADLPVPAARDVRIGIMGLGVLGMDSARKLSALGYRVGGWSRTPKTIDGIETFHGEEGLTAFLGRTDILISLLPLTQDTKGLINRDLIRQLARDGQLQGPCLINAGRGGVQVEADIIAALDAGELHEVTLDVFETEPLPQHSTLWQHPRVTVSPHNSAPSTPAGICQTIAGQIRAFESGGQLENLVDPLRGY